MSDTILGQFIPLHYHYQMLLDQQRVQGFKEAIDAYVTEGSTVLELGGGTGILSWFAAQKAKKVYCVEKNSQMVAQSRKYLAANPLGDRVEVIEADATEYVPPEPVSVVICEMLHSAMLREKQIQVIEAFKRNFVKKFGAEVPLPRFIPEHTFLGIQLVNQNYNFEGYLAPIPMFSQPTLPHPELIELSDAVLYSQCEYAKPLPQVFATSQEIPLTQDGTVNAVRFITKNILAIILSEEKTVDWHNYYMVLPIEKPLELKAGERVKVSFNYHAGDDLSLLTVSGTKV